ncbi:Ulp1 protease family, C-terminal catalytic domain [Sesbania bispinosa]|nr:Ulp1 protease family, C-terminal catalytic domain [Sesbania bispinosa]
MAGTRKGFRRKDPPRPTRRSPRIEELNVVEKKIRDLKRLLRFRPAYVLASHKVSFAKRVKGLNEEYGEQSEKDHLRDLVKCLASIIVNGNNFTQSQLAAGLPLLLTTCLTPKNSSVKRTIEADKMDGSDNCDHYINKKPIPSFNNDAIKRGLKIPYWMQLSFRPPVDMDLDNLEIVTAAYIFHTDLAGGSNGKTLRTLMPAIWIDQEVLNLLASKLTYFESKISTNNSAWFLPTTFAQYALTWGSTPEAMIKRYQEKFMGKVDYLCKIFVPINDQDSHWYLMIIDVNHNKIVILDSLMCELRNGWRKRHAKKLWMSDYVWDDDYNSISVTHTTRMKMALDLVLNSYNEHKYKFIRLAVEKWKQLHEERKQLVKV